MFSTNFIKICCSFAQNQIFEKIQDGGQDGGHLAKRQLP